MTGYVCLSASSSVISDGCPATLHVSFEYIDWAICKPFISFKEPLKTGNHSLPPAHLCVSSPVYTLSDTHTWLHTPPEIHRFNTCTPTQRQKASKMPITHIRLSRKHIACSSEAAIFARVSSIRIKKEGLYNKQTNRIMSNMA